MKLFIFSCMVHFSYLLIRYYVSRVVPFYANLCKFFNSLLILNNRIKILLTLTIRLGLEHRQKLMAGLPMFLEHQNHLAVLQRKHSETNWSKTRIRCVFIIFWFVKLSNFYLFMKMIIVNGHCKPLKGMGTL